MSGGRLANKALWRSAVAGLLIWLVLGTCAQASDATQSGKDPLLIEFERYSGKLAQRDKTPLLRLYNSGRLVVHFPSYMKRAGEYTTTLSQPEVKQLLDEMTAANLAGAAAQVTVQQIRSDQRQHQQQDTAFYRSETTFTRLTVNTRGASATSVLTNLQSDAGRIGTRALREAAAAERALLMLAVRPDLVAVDTTIPKFPGGSDR